MELRYRANAKLNLCLDITGTRQDGYHLIDSVMLSVNLYDELTVREASEFSVSSSVPYLPTDERNIVHKAARALAEYCGLPLFGAHIHVKKNIPTQAGMGGGSADGAATLVALNELFSLGLSQTQLAEVGLKVGSDIPFCLSGGCARVGGIGEEITPIKSALVSPFVVVMPRRGTSTRDAFAKYDEGIQLNRPDCLGVQSAVERGDVSSLAKLFGNVFEQLVSGGETDELKSLLCEHGALSASLTGSGSAVYGIFSDLITASKCRNALRRRVHRCYLVTPVAAGVERID